MTHPFAAGDKIQFGGWHDDFNRRFISKFSEADHIVTVTEALTEPDGFGTLTHYVRIAEDTSPDDDVVPTWNVNWFNPTPITNTALEATMPDSTTRPFVVGDRVRVTAARTKIGGPGPGEKGTYIGATATITDAMDEALRAVGDGSYMLDFDDPDLSNFGTWSTKALDLVSPADEAADELARVTRSLQVASDRVDVLQAERAHLTQAASDERRRLVAEIDELRAERDGLTEDRANLQAKVDTGVEERAELLDVIAEIKDEVTLLTADLADRRKVLADTIKERDTVALVLDYAMGMLDPVQNQRVLGYWDGVSAE